MVVSWTFSWDELDDIVITGRRPLARGDSTPHFDTVETKPHHLHVPGGEVLASPVSGVSADDIRVVLKFISALTDQA
jgi:hypothetical protein